MPCLRFCTVPQQAAVLRAPAQQILHAATHSKTCHFHHFNQQISPVRTNSYSEASPATSERPVMTHGDLSTHQDSEPVSPADQELSVLVDVLPDRVQSLLGQRSTPSQV